jgi:hypothetical protein
LNYLHFIIRLPSLNRPEVVGNCISSPLSRGGPLIGEGPNLFETDLLVDAIREYIDETAHSESFQELVATKYHDGQLDFEAVKRLVGAEIAQRLRLLKADLDGKPFDLAAPDDIDMIEVASEWAEDGPGTR